MKLRSFKEKSKTMKKKTSRHLRPNSPPSPTFAHAHAPSRPSTTPMSTTTCQHRHTRDHTPTRSHVHTPTQMYSLFLCFVFFLVMLTARTQDTIKMESGTHGKQLDATTTDRCKRMSGSVSFVLLLLLAHAARACGVSACLGCRPTLLARVPVCPKMFAQRATRYLSRWWRFHMQKFLRSLFALFMDFLIS